VNSWGIPPVNELICQQHHIIAGIPIRELDGGGQV
jgi:hypothetical protein